MRIRTLTASFCLLSCLVTTPLAAAQSNPPQNLFRQVIPFPTGRNGYEELVLAGDRLQASKVYVQWRDQWDRLSLEQKRQLLADRQVTEALRLLRQGLAKPVSSPRQELGFDTALPELQTFRDLARVLVMQQYVQLADGRTAEAVSTARTCLRLGRAIQTDTLISGLVGVAISTLGVKALAVHLDQLSARDCEQLYQVVQEALAIPDPQPRLFALDLAVLHRTLQECLVKARQNDTAGVQRLLSLDAESAAATEAYLRSLPPGGLERMAQSMLGRLDQHAQRLQEELRKAPWQRQRLDGQFSSDGSMEAKFVDRLMPSVDTMGDRFNLEQAHLRLLACHCAILRFRWEHDRLPARLEELRLGDLVLDPFTGQPLEYQVAGRRYTLTSAGPLSNSADSRSVNGRSPTSLQ